MIAALRPARDRALALACAVGVGASGAALAQVPVLPGDPKPVPGTLRPPEPAAPVEAVPLSAPPSLPERVLIRKKPSEDDPFAPPGIRAGAFVLKPNAEVTVGYDSNPLRDRTPTGSLFERVEGEIDARSDWLRHSLGGYLRGSYTTYNALPREDRPRVEALVENRIDVTRDTRVETSLRGLLDTENPGDPDTPKGAKGPLLTYSYGATTGVTHRFNRLELGLRGSVDRYLFSEVGTAAGVQTGAGGGLRTRPENRDYTAYETRARAGYELSPILQPYVELGLNTRRYDRPADELGVRRGSTGWRATAGARYEPTALLKAELALGYGEQDPIDPGLRMVGGVVFDGKLSWAVTPLTTLALRGATDFGETTLAGASGTLTYAFGFEARHALRRWLELKGEVAYDRERFVGIGRIDDGVTASLAIEWRLNRSMVAQARLAREQQFSTVRSDRYTANIAEVGFRAQR